MWVLLLGLVLFVGIHSVQMVAPGWREARISTMGEGPWKGLYSLASVAGLILIILGWGLYRPDSPEVFSPPSWGRHLAMLLVLIGFVLNVAAYAPRGYIATAVRHPMITGVALWALGHLFANGDLASLLLFGGLLAWSIWNRIAVERRPARQAASTGPRGDIIALVAGTLLYLLFLFWLHPWLFGVSPLA